MSHIIREVHGPEHADLIRFLNSKDALFPPLEDHHFRGFWWLAFDEHKSAIAFAGMVPMQPFTSCWYLKRCYVAERARGHGLQRKFLKLREVKAAEYGIRQLVAECPANSASESNFVHAEYERVNPEQKWGAPDSAYFSKRIKPRIS